MFGRRKRKRCIWTSATWCVLQSPHSVMNHWLPSPSLKLLLESHSAPSCPETEHNPLEDSVLSADFKTNFLLAGFSPASCLKSPDNGVFGKGGRAKSAAEGQQSPWLMVTDTPLLGQTKKAH